MFMDLVQGGELFDYIVDTVRLVLLLFRDAEKR